MNDTFSEWKESIEQRIEYLELKAKKPKPKPDPDPDTVWVVTWFDSDLNLKINVYNDEEAAWRLYNKLEGSPEAECVDIDDVIVRDC